MTPREQQLRTLGYNIAILREGKSISQIQMARMLGYTNHAHLSRIESGKKAPSLYTILDIAEILEVDVQALFEDV